MILNKWLPQETLKDIQTKMNYTPLKLTLNDEINLLNHFGDDMDFAKRVLNGLLPVIEASVEKLQKFCKDKNLHLIRYQAKVIKAISVHISIVALHNIAFKIETAAEKGDLALSLGLMPELEQTVHVTVAAIKSVVSQAGKTHEACYSSTGQQQNCSTFVSFVDDLSLEYKKAGGSNDQPLDAVNWLSRSTPPRNDNAEDELLGKEGTNLLSSGKKDFFQENLPGINFAAGRERCDQNNSLYIKLLQNFKQNKQHESDVIRTLLIAGGSENRPQEGS